MKRKCDWCGGSNDVKATHYGTTFGYVRLMCSECAEAIKKETGNEVKFLDEGNKNSKN